MKNLLLEIKDIKKKFGDHEALKGVSLELYRGEVVSLLGPNGAGKTTLSTIVATLKPPTAGDVVFKNKSIYTNISFYRQHIGYCPQKPNLNDNLTLRDNLKFAGHYFGLSITEINQKIDQLSTIFGLNNYLDKFPPVLSGGYKQRFLIARSLIHSPELIILDEPTIALDPHIRNQLWDYIRLLKNEGMCVLLTTHYLDEAEALSDRVCVLDQGRVRLIDTPANLMSLFNKGRLEDVFIHLMQES